MMTLLTGKWIHTLLGQQLINGDSLLFVFAELQQIGGEDVEGQFQIITTWTTQMKRLIHVHGLLERWTRQTKALHSVCFTATRPLHVVLQGTQSQIVGFHLLSPEARLQTDPCVSMLVSHCWDYSVFS